MLCFELWGGIPARFAWALLATIFIVWDMATIPLETLGGDERKDPTVGA